MADAPRRYEQRPREIPEPSRDLAAELNPEQAHAATFGDGPLLVVAGAGTGKTRTLIYRVAHLLERRVRPERILLLTFTRRAAQEMLARAERLVGQVSRQVHGGTFHATAHRLLRKFGAQAGLASDFTIMDQADAEDLMQLARAQLGYGDKGKRFPKKETLHYVYSRHVNTEFPVEQILSEEYAQFSDYTEDFQRIFADYARRKEARNLVDYDDLLLFWAMMVEAPGLAERIAGLYDHVLVDEYQDTNTLQARILRGMCATHRNITVVGDDAQSIYSFRGATIRNILDFPRQFAGTTMVTLEQNYRSVQPILETTNTLISRAEERFTKSLWSRRAGGESPWLVACKDESEQTRFVVDRILELHEEGIPLADMAVLFRAGYMSADLEIELANRRIPFEKWGGLKFLEAAHVKDVLAFLRILENPRDEVSWYRLFLLLDGIGDVTARGLIGQLAERHWQADAIGDLAVPPRARESRRRLAELFHSLASPIPTDREARTGKVGVALDIARIRRMYDDILREKYDRVDPRLADLDQLESIAGGYADRSSFLVAAALEPPSSTQDLAGESDEETDTLVLSTCHSAKGKEWKAVFVIWCVDGWFPSTRSLGDDDELEEERRLMYVAMTRAKDHLMVTYPVHVYSTRRGADYSIDQLSRFLDRGVQQTMQKVVIAAPEAPRPADPPPAQGVIDLRALLRGRFGG